MSAGDLSKIVSALDLIYYALSVTSVLYLLDGYRVEVNVSLVDIDGVLVVYECIRIVIRYPEDVFT